jgi:hypothetical protein
VSLHGMERRPPFHRVTPRAAQDQACNPLNAFDPPCPSNHHMRSVIFYPSEAQAELRVQSRRTHTFWRCKHRTSLQHMSNAGFSQKEWAPLLTMPNARLSVGPPLQEFNNMRSTNRVVTQECSDEKYRYVPCRGPEGAGTGS